MDSGFDASPFRSSASNVLTPPPTGMVCRKCGYQAYPDATFCRHCGANLPARKRTRSALKRQRVAATKRTTRQPAGPEESARTAVMLLIGILLVIAAGLSWWLTRN